MRKNYFKSLATAMMLTCLGFGLTSCELDNADNPVAPTPAPVVEPTDDTEYDASITVSKLSDVTASLEQLKDKISAKAGSEFAIKVTADGDLTTSGSDNTIALPDLSDFNISLNIKSKVNTSAAPLTIKQSAEATTIYKNCLKLDLANDDADLVLDLPGTTTTLNKLNSLQILNGMSIVKTGGEVKTFVWAPTSNDYSMNDSDSEWVEITDAEGNSVYKPNVQPENGDGNSYKFKNLKIVKGKADYARINAWNIDYTLDKLTIAEGCTVLLNYYPYIKEIVGEGSGAIVKSTDIWWNNTEEKTIATDINLYEINKISNITFEAFIDGDFKEGTLVSSAVYNAPSEIDYCTFKYSRIDFRDPQSASAIVKHCMFVGTDDEKSISITVPYQTEEINSFNFSFYKCEFSKDCMFYNGVMTSKPKLDENGKQVYKDFYRWWVFTDEGQPDWTWYKSESLDDVPESKKEIGQTEGGWTQEEGKSLNGYSTGYWIEQEAQYEEVEFKDYYIYVSFTKCKIDGATLSASNINIASAWAPSGAYIRYEFDGKTYRALWDSENEKYILIEV